MTTLTRNRLDGRHPVRNHPLIKVLVNVVVLFAFIFPIYLFVKSTGSHPPGRSDPPGVTNVADMPIPAYANAIPVLTYHDITNRPARTGVTPQRFAEQMAALHQAGFHAITVKQLFAFYHGAKLPDRPILITFDDGLGSTWRIADPIMEKYQLRGTIFVISGEIGKHGYYYLHPRELRSMVRSDRWDIEAHTDMAHQYVQTDKLGHEGPVLANREWMPGVQRLESIQDYTSRIVSDINRNVATLRSYGAHPQVFAFPFSAIGVPSNDPRVVGILDRIIARRFPISFVDSDHGARFTTRSDFADRQQLPRLEVYRDTTAHTLLSRIRSLAPTPSDMNGFPESQWLSEGGDHNTSSSLVRHGKLTLVHPNAHWYATYWNPAQTQLWKHYQIDVNVSGLSQESKKGNAAVLLVGSAGARGYAIAISAGRLQIKPQRGRHPLAYVHLPSDADSHHVTAKLSNQLSVTVDGKLVTTLRVDPKTHGGLGFGTWQPVLQGSGPVFDGLRVRPI